MPKNKVNNNIKLKSGGGIINGPDGLSVENVSTLIAGEDIVSGEAIYLGSVPTTPISYDTSVGASVSINADPQVITQAITIGDNSDRYLVVSVFATAGNGSNGTPGVSSITYAGVALTLLVSSDTSKLYGLANPTVGTNNLIINTAKISGSTPYFGNVAYFAHAFYDCEYDDDFTGSGYTLATTLTVEGSIVVGSGVKYGFGNGTPYTSSDLTENFLTANTGAVNAYGGWQPTLGDITGTGNITTGAGVGAPDLALGVVLKPANLPTYGVARLTTTADPDYNGNRYLKFIGFSASDALEGESLDITTSGIVKSLSGLTPNSFYYLQDTAGKIDVSAGTNEKKVGIAISATELLLL